MRWASRRVQLALKLLIFSLMVVAIGLPINHLFYYSLLAIAVVVLAIGRVTGRRGAWSIAVIVVAAAISAKMIVKVPAIEEGHNIFLPGSAMLAAGLPRDVYDAMIRDFDLASPPASRCGVTTPGCWQNDGRPDRVYAFSFDGIYDAPAYSRRVTGIDFSDAEWQRLGFVNELRYNWSSTPNDIDRARRQRGWRGLLHPWRITMPHFVMYRFPAGYVGSQLCWRGTVLWEVADGQFSSLRHDDPACQTIAAIDVGRRIFGLAVAPASPLAMTLRPTMKVRLCQFFKPALAFVVVAALLFILLQWNVRRLLLPLTLIGLAVVVMIGNDATLLGGLRPFDGGDDGLVYDGWSRIIVQQLLNGDIVGALKGVEPVFVFTPGSRYLRAVEHLIFGESYFGYVSLLLLLPFLVFCLFRRYLTARAALAVTLIFVAFPIGALFGSTFYLYVKHAAHGYGDPAAAVFFIAATLGLIGCARSGPSLRFGPALRSGLLFALALFVRPNLAIGAAILLGGAGLAALWQLQYRRLAGLCVGFLPVFGATLHNWYYGGAFVLFSTQTSAPASMPMPPYAYGSALWELLHLNFSGNVARGGRQILLMLVGPSESFAMAPLYAVALVIIVRVTMSARFDNWLRLIAIGTLGLYTPALFFIYSDRYLLVAWLFTLLICFVWLCDEGLPWIERRYPGLVDGVLRRRGAIWLSRWLDTFARACGVLPPAAISAK